MTEKDLSGIYVSEEAKEFIVNHKGIDYEFKMKELPWLLSTRIMSGCVKPQKDGSVIIDKSDYDIQYLEAALVEAPWQLDKTRLHLRKLSQSFGNKLSAHIPNPNDIDDEDLKKE